MKKFDLKKEKQKVYKLIEKKRSNDCSTNYI